MALSEAAARSRFAVGISVRREHRQALEVASAFLLPTWRAWAVLRASSRRHYKARRQDDLQGRLAHWRNFAARGRRETLLLRRAEAMKVKRRRQARREAIRTWELCSVESCRLRLREQLMGYRVRRRVLQAACCAWLRLLRMARREKRSRLVKEVEEARKREEDLQSELEEMRSMRASRELAHLQLVDELHTAVRETAEAEVDQREARQANAVVERATELECEAVRRLEAEAASIQAQTEEFLERRALMRSALEDRLTRGLAAPEMLRERLRQCEEEVHIAARSEVQAEERAATLCEELEDMHRTASARLRAKDAEVASIRAEVGLVQRSEQELYAELAQRRTALQRHDFRSQQAATRQPHLADR